MGMSGREFIDHLLSQELSHQIWIETTVNNCPVKIPITGIERRNDPARGIGLAIVSEEVQLLIKAVEVVE